MRRLKFPTGKKLNNGMDGLGSFVFIEFVIFNIQNLMTT